jgi:hypothetical protein
MPNERTPTGDTPHRRGPAAPTSNLLNPKQRVRIILPSTMTSSQTEREGAYLTLLPILDTKRTLWFFYRQSYVTLVSELPSVHRRRACLAVNILLRSGGEVLARFTAPIGLCFATVRGHSRVCHQRRAVRGSRGTGEAVSLWCRLGRCPWCELIDWAGTSGSGPPKSL